MCEQRDIKRQAGAHSNKELAFENFYDADAEVEHLVQRCRDRLVFNNINLAERYLTGKIRIALALSCEVGGQQIYAFFQIAPWLQVDLNGLVIGCSESTDRTTHDGSRQGLMLIHPVKVVQGVEQVVPSLVRFHIADECFSRIGEPLYFFFGVGFKRLPSLSEDREVDIRRFRGTVFDGEATGQVIKRGAQVMNGISGDERDFGRHFLGCFNDEILLSRDCVHLPFHPKRFFREEGGDELIDIVDVGFGPFDL